jgi:large subunit ribosomal protein L9
LTEGIARGRDREILARRDAMKVILLEELKGRGGEGDVIEVAQGFAVNYLLPRKIAIKATPGNLKQLELRKHNIEKREVLRLDDAKAALETLADKVVGVRAKVGEDGQLFGSVTAAHISEALLAQYRVEVDRKKIDIRKPIKTSGEHEVVISIYRDVKATIKVLVLDEVLTDEEVEILLSGGPVDGQDDESAEPVSDGAAYGAELSWDAGDPDFPEGAQDAESAGDDAQGDVEDASAAADALADADAADAVAADADSDAADADADAASEAPEEPEGSV